MARGPQSRSSDANFGAPDKVYDGMVGDHREEIAVAGDVNPATEDILIGQTAEVEKLQWFVRAHLENATGSLRTLDDASEEAAARDASA